MAGAAHPVLDLDSVRAFPIRNNVIHCSQGPFCMSFRGVNMTVTVEATYQDGSFKSAQPVSLPDGAKVQLTITPMAEKDGVAAQGMTGSSPAPRAAQNIQEARAQPVFVWSKAMYRARKAAQEFSKETHADY
jgi:predicted DNA-binding antitoxin AbrB/MazE fold protein